MAVVAFQAAGLIYDHVNFVIAAPANHPFNTYFGDMGIDNAADGTRDYSNQLLQMLAFALCRRDPANSAELDNMYYVQHGIDELTIFQAIAQAINSGFVHGVTATADVQQNGYAIIRAALPLQSGPGRPGPGPMYDALPIGELDVRALMDS